MGDLTMWMDGETPHIAYYQITGILEFLLPVSSNPSWRERTAYRQVPLEEYYGALTNWFSVPDFLQHIGFVDGNQHVQDLHSRPGAVSWSIHDIYNDTGGPLALPNAITSWFHQYDRTQHIAYIDGRGHVEEVYVTAGTTPWQIRDVTDDIRASSRNGKWAQAGALTTWQSLSGDNLQHIAYIDQRGHIQDCYMRPGQYPWQNYDVTSDTGEPLAQPGELISWWSNPVPNVVPYQQHIAYIDGRGHVEEVYVTPGSPPWQIRDVTDDIRAHSGMWAQAGALTTWFSTVDGLRHIAYIDQRGHIQDCYMRPGQYPWQNYNVTKDTGSYAQPGALTSWWQIPIPSVNRPNQQHIIYIDNNTHVQEAFVTPGSPPWKIRKLL